MLDVRMRAYYVMDHTASMHIMVPRAHTVSTGTTNY